MVKTEFDKVPVTARIWVVYGWLILLLLFITFLDRVMFNSQYYSTIVKPTSIVLVLGLIVELVFIIPFLLNPRKYIKKIDKAKAWLKLGILFSVVSILLSWVLVLVSVIQADSSWREIVFWIALIYSPAAGALGLAAGCFMGWLKRLTQK